MTNVPVSRQRAPAWPCHSTCATGPWRVLTGVSFRERALESAQSPKNNNNNNKIKKIRLQGFIPAPPGVPAAPVAATARGDPESKAPSGGSPLPTCTSMRLRALRGAPASPAGLGAGDAARDGQAERCPSQRCWGLDRSPRAPPGRARDAVGARRARGARFAAGTPRPWVASAASTATRGDCGRSSAARGPPRPGGIAPRPGSYCNRPGRPRYSEWQATPSLAPSVRVALRRA